MNNDFYAHVGAASGSADIPSENRLSVYIDYPIGVTDEDVCETAERASKCGMGLIIPTFDVGGFDYIHPMRLLHLYGVLLSRARELGLRVALNLTKDIEAGVVDYLEDECDDLPFDDKNERVRQRVLLKREYFCSDEETVNIEIREKVVSLTALEEQGELIDLRGYLKDDILSFEMPHGNWRIIRYFCAEDAEHKAVNTMNYAASVKYLETLMTLFADNFADYIGSTLTHITFSDIGFSAPNRRNWDEAFGERFMERYSFDPAPYYPCLYDTDDVKHRHYKALLMANRAEMLENGFMRAVNDVAERYGMTAVGSLSEPKISASSWTLGDALLCQKNTPCAVLEKAYLYGINSVAVAAGAAVAGGGDRVYCELFRDYERMTTELAYRETMTAVARGANRFMLHLPKNASGKEAFVCSKELEAYAEYMGKLQTLLCGTEAVSDIMLLYPIYSLQSKTCLYEADVEGRFEYPDTPDTTDYMTLINSVCSYTGQPLSLVHPRNFAGFRIDHGCVISNTGARARVVILPATEMISVENLRMISEFFDGGGKVIATGTLPRLSFEISESGESFDDEVVRLAEHIFGGDAVNGTLYSDYAYNRNENGGEAYFMYSASTGSDRTYFVPGERIMDAIMSFDIPYDVYVSGMPRLECTGALNNNYPEYRMLGLDTSINGGGMFGVLHRRDEKRDIYFFSNGTDVDYLGDVFIRGEHSLTEWNATAGKATGTECTHIERRGARYTRFKLRLDSGSAAVFISERQNTTKTK